MLIDVYFPCYEPGHEYQSDLLDCMGFIESCTNDKFGKSSKLIVIYKVIHLSLAYLFSPCCAVLPPYPAVAMSPAVIVGCQSHPTALDVISYHRIIFSLFTITLTCHGLNVDGSRDKPGEGSRIYK